jgi:hypothetical protein
MLRPEMLDPIEAMVVRTGKVDKLDIFLRSSGGVAEVPWHVVSTLREFCDRLGIIVSGRALSGATHIAISGDEIVMGPTARLGSVDPKRTHPLLPKDEHGNQIPVSVEELKLCVEFIKQQLGESYPNQNLALIISELFKYINPLALGAIEQSFNLSKLMTRKCLKSRKTPLEEEHIERVVEMLASKYYSHSFLISRSEVESDLNLPITKPDSELLEAINRLHQFYVGQFQIETPPDSQGVSHKLAGVLQYGSFGFGVVQVKHHNNPISDFYSPFDYGGNP